MPQDPWPKSDNQRYKMNKVFHEKKANEADSLAKKYDDISSRADSAGNFFGGNTTTKGSYFFGLARKQEKIAQAHRKAAKEY